jgi:NAD(P)-dependent dehydrogenase (short-subunit alcohol dehydrogenase family)
METTKKSPSETGVWDPAGKSRKVTVVTGIGSGIGFAAAAALSREGFDLIGVVRSEERAKETRAALESAVPGIRERLTFVVGDLSKRRDVLRLVEEIGSILDEKHAGRLDRLLCSAGTVTSWYLATEDGYETQFAVNHLAVFQFAVGLESRLEASGDGRVLVISSGSHYRTRIRWNDPMHRRLYDPLAAYKQSKLANVLFVHGFNARFATDRLRAYAVDPGLVDTGIGEKGTSGLVRWVWSRRRKGGATPEKGASTAVALACAELAPRGVYEYYKDCLSVKPSAYSLKKANVDRFWAVSERLCGREERDAT